MNARSSCRLNINTLPVKFPACGTLISLYILFNTLLQSLLDPQLSELCVYLWCNGTKA